jgi:hypothetical protein
MYQFVLQHEVGIVLVLAVLFLASGCAARLAVHPGAINQVDSAAYDALLIAEAAIDQAKAEYAAGQLAGNKQALDALIASYDVTRLAWLTYRGALSTNVPSQAYLDTLNKNLTDLTNAIRALEEAK